MSELFGRDDNVAQTTQQLAEQPEPLHFPNSTCSNQDEFAKKQRIMETMPAVFDSNSTFTDTPKTLSYDAIVSSVPMNGTKNGRPFDKQPLAQEPPLHMLFLLLLLIANGQTDASTRHCAGSEL